MKSIVNSFLICFSMYTSIPLPTKAWEKDSVRYVFIFFPLIGVVIGGFEILWYHLAIYLGISGVFYGAVGVAIPVILSGGIHLDGFADTCDAWASRASKEKKADILKDPRVGAFAVIYTVVYFLIFFGAFVEFYYKSGALIVLFATFILSRILGAFTSLFIRGYKKSGTLFAFSSNSGKFAVAVFLFAYLALLALLIFAFTPYYVIFLVMGVMVLWFIIFRNFCLYSFGGMSGDLAGFGISIAELLFIVCAAFPGVSL